MFIHLRCLCPLDLDIQLNFNILKEAVIGKSVILLVVTLHFFSAESIYLCMGSHIRVSSGFQTPITKFFSQLQCVWKLDETLFKVFETSCVLHISVIVAFQAINNNSCSDSGNKSSPKFIIINITFPNLLYVNEFLGS